MRVETNTISKGFTKVCEESIKNFDDKRLDKDYGQKSTHEYL